MYVCVCVCVCASLVKLKHNKNPRNFKYFKKYKLITKIV